MPGHFMAAGHLPLHDPVQCWHVLQFGGLPKRSSLPRAHPCCCAGQVESRWHWRWPWATIAAGPQAAMPALASKPGAAVTAGRLEGFEGEQAAEAAMRGVLQGGALLQRPQLALQGLRADARAQLLAVALAAVQQHIQTLPAAAQRYLPHTSSHYSVCIACLLIPGVLHRCPAVSSLPQCSCCAAWQAACLLSEALRWRLQLPRLRRHLQVLRRRPQCLQGKRLSMGAAGAGSAGFQQCGSSHGLAGLLPPRAAEAGCRGSATTATSRMRPGGPPSE